MVNRESAEGSLRKERVALRQFVMEMRGKGENAQNKQKDHQGALILRVELQPKSMFQLLSVGLG